MNDHESLRDIAEYLRGIRSELRWLQSLVWLIWVSALLYIGWRHGWWL